MKFIIWSASCLILVNLIGSVAGESESASNIAIDKKTQRDHNEYDEETDDDADVVYDERQTDGETNIQLHIKNLQIQVPSLDVFQETNMATVVRDSILKLFGIPYSDADDVDAVQPELTEQEEQQQTESNSMLQVNGNNLPAKFFLEISDFLMKNHDNDAIDDIQVESNHRKNEEIHATEEVKIERLENVHNVKNETITISKKRYNNKVVAPAQNHTLFETTDTENRFRNNVTQNHTETEDIFHRTRPIRLDTVVMRVESSTGEEPKTLREKVIWTMDNGDSESVH